MYIRRFLRRRLLFIKTRFLRRTKNKLVCIIITAVGLYIFIITCIEKPGGSLEDTEDPADDYQRIKKVFIKKTKNPPIIWWNVNAYNEQSESIKCVGNISCETFGAKFRLPYNTAGAYLFYASNINFSYLPLPRQPEQVIWAFTHEESPRNILEFLHEPGLNLFNFSSTFSRFSDVPFPLHMMESLEEITNRTHFVSTSRKNEFLKEISPILFASSNDYTFTDRTNYVRELMGYIPIDCYGKCLNNKKFTEDPKDYLNNFYDTALVNNIARYKFMITIENGVCDDYITEKFWRPIIIGVVPIYYGSPTIKDWFPNNKSAILIKDYPSPKELSEYLYKLLGNDSLYEEYLEHKTKGLLTNKRLIEEMRIRPYQTDVSARISEFQCFICKKLHENIIKPKLHIVTKSQYNCSLPFSALTQASMENNDFLNFEEYTREISKRAYDSVLTAKC